VAGKLTRRILGSADWAPQAYAANRRNASRASSP
jgi:hypothetical protein